jgi:hypothetical protein
MLIYHLIGVKNETLEELKLIKICDKVKDM